jgi:hypothetical protein
MKSGKLYLAAFAVVIVGCGSSDHAYTPTPVKEPALTSVAPGEEATLFPAAVGNQWTYSVSSQAVIQGQQQGNAQKITMEVTAVEPVADGQDIKVDMREDDIVKSHQVWRVTKQGVYQVSVAGDDGKATNFEPPQLLLPFPLELNKEIPWEGKAPAPGLGICDFKSKVVDEGPQITDTLAGEMSAYRVVTTSEVTGQKGVKGEMESILWFAPKVGLVRFQQSLKAPGGATAQTMQLIQYTVK